MPGRNCDFPRGKGRTDVCIYGDDAYYILFRRFATVLRVHSHQNVQHLDVVAAFREVLGRLWEKQQPRSGQQGWKRAYEHEKVPRVEEKIVLLDAHLQRNDDPTDT